MWQQFEKILVCASSINVAKAWQMRKKKNKIIEQKHVVLLAWQGPMNCFEKINRFFSSFPFSSLPSFSSRPLCAWPRPCSWRWDLAFLFLMMTLQSCGPNFQHYEKVEDSLRLENPNQAVEFVEQAKGDYQEDNKLLYILDMGMTLHLAGQYQESNKFFEQADEWIERAYTRHIHELPTPFWLNEGAVPYRGDRYEHVFINVIKALNYALLGDPDRSTGRSEKN